MTDDKKKMTAQGSSVGADDGQSISQNSKTTIPDPDEKSNSPERDLEELYRKMRRMSDPAYLHTVTLSTRIACRYLKQPKRPLCPCEKSTEIQVLGGNEYEKNFVL